MPDWKSTAGETLQRNLNSHAEGLSNNWYEVCNSATLFKFTVSSEILHTDAPSVSWLSSRCGSLDLWHPYGPSWPVTETTLPFNLIWWMINVCLSLCYVTVIFYKNPSLVEENVVSQEQTVWTLPAVGTSMLHNQQLITNVYYICQECLSLFVQMVHSLYVTVSNIKIYTRRNFV
jgi:hypothetical protein